MQVVIHPFFSQQSKVTGEFLLDTDSNYKYCSFLAERIRAELGWDAILPDPYMLGTPTNNKLQKVNWDTKVLAQLYAGADIAVLNHETLATPLRAVYPELTIVQMCLVKPGSLEEVAWDNAHLVTTHSKPFAKYIRQCTDTPVSVWPAAYDVRLFPQQPECARDIDVLFVTRCSVTNHTHHREFLAALPALIDLRVVFTDVTDYLKLQHPEFEYSTPETYLSTLRRSKVAVSLQANWFSSAVREAAASGCTVVALDDAPSRELTGAYFTVAEPAAIAAAIRRALAEPRAVDVSQESYQAAWPKIAEDLCRLSR